MNKIILASQSPRRKQLLEWAEIPFEIFVKETSENYPPGLEPKEIAVYIAQQKAATVQKLVSSNQTILAADTIVVLGENIIGKPVHREEAVSILFALSGEKHHETKLSGFPSCGDALVSDHCLCPPLVHFHVL